MNEDWIENNGDGTFSESFIGGFTECLKESVITNLKTSMLFKSNENNCFRITISPVFLEEKNL